MRIVALIVLAAWAIMAWKVAMILSPDAIGMAVGMLFGVLAVIPVVGLIMAAQRQRAPDPDDKPEPQAPAIIVYTPQPQVSQRIYNSAPRVITLPVSAEQARVRRLAAKGLLAKLSDGFEGEIPPGFRRLARIDGSIEKGDWQ